MLRNIGIVAHINAGKTTLTEHILFNSGKQRFLGDVDSGTATMDWMVEEQRRGISITAAVTSVGWRGDTRIQLIDTPGHVDFTVEVERCLRVLDGVVVLLDGIRGVESQTESVWRRAREHGLPSLVFVNKLDRSASDFEASVRSAAAAFECRVEPIARPVFVDGEFVAVVDLVEGAVAWTRDGCERDVLPGPAEILAWRQDLVAACADFDEEVFTSYVEGRDVSAAALRVVLRRATLRPDCALVPALCGSAMLDAGVDLLLDAVRDYLPSPLEGEEANALARLKGADRVVSALVFKVHVGEDGMESLGFLRIFSGDLRPGDRLEVASTSTPLVVSELWRMHSMERETVDLASVGDFVAVTLPMPLRTGETLRSPGSDVVLEDMRFPEPVLTMALEPRTSSGRVELEARARAMAFEDPTLVVRRENEGGGGLDGGDGAAGGEGRLFVSGMGELHLEVFGSRLNRRLSEPARFGRPHVARYESVRGEAEDASDLHRRVGELDVSCRIRVRVSPFPTGDSAEDVGSANKSRLRVLAGAVRPDSAVSAAFLGQITDGLLAALRSGIVGAYPARDLSVEILELDVQPGLQSSDESALDAGDLAVVAGEAAVIATRRAIGHAGRLVLEPEVGVFVRGPADTFGSVLADLRSRGADILSVIPEFGFTEAAGRVRLSAVVDYAGALRSMTQGKASVRFELGRFVVAPEEA